MNSFVVKSPSDLSDHCLISINIQCENKSFNVEEETLWSLPGTFKWSDQNDDLYIDSLIGPDNSENILFLNKLLDDDSFNDTYLLVDKTNDIYIQAAKNRYILIATAWLNGPKRGMRHLWKVLYGNCSFHFDPLTNMAVIGNSCFLLVDFLFTFCFCILQLK
jgi:hypothetical protein